PLPAPPPWFRPNGSVQHRPQRSKLVAASAWHCHFPNGPFSGVLVCSEAQLYRPFQTPREGMISRLGGMDDEAVDNALAARLVEVDGELVAVHFRHLAVAEFLVEYSLPLRVAGNAGRGGDKLTIKRKGRTRFSRTFAPTALLGSLPARGGVAARKSRGWFVKA